MLHGLEVDQPPDHCIVSVINRRQILSFFACEHEHLELVKFLLSRGASPELVNKGRQNALHAACINGNVAIVQELIKHGTPLRQVAV